MRRLAPKLSPRLVQNPAPYPTQPLGVGQLLANFDEDNDGTIAVSETRMPGMSAHIALPVSHLGMLMSARVAHETGTFLTEGRFSV